MRGWATGLLLAMAGLWLASRWAEARGFHGVVLVRAFSEAAMVGAFADWFAVTALFRRPFGLPIPHTAIIARNKDRIGDSLGGFVANNFLVPAVVLPRLAQVDVAARLADWLADRRNGRAVAGRLASTVPSLLAGEGDARLRAFLRAVVAKRLGQVEAAPLVGRILALLVAHRKHQALFDHALDWAALFLYRNRAVIRDKVASKSGRWMPDWVDDKLTEKILTGVSETVDEARHPDHPWREDFHEAILGLSDSLIHDPAYAAAGERIRDDLLRHPAVRAYFDALWADLRAVATADASRDDGRMQAGIERALQAFAARLREDEALRAMVNGWLERAVLAYVIPNRGEIGAFIAGVVRMWDTRTVVDKLELQVGRDLQYIRINGTLVGGLVGLIIHLLGQAMG
ncbi:MAG: DUF445 domain-containing protein [Alphaproteobacteria bacterium]|nr:DUF445 domain-containing protein [Alphaproteobacteria bacterium]